MMRKFVSALLILLLTACIPPVYQKPYPVGPVVLPSDEAAHPAPIEWWYYTGHLQDQSGHEYGFELSFFKAYTPPQLKLLGIPAFIVAEKGHVAHFAITDKTAQTFEKAEKADFWGHEAEASSEDLDVYISNWYTRRNLNGISHDIFATLGHRQLKLTLTPEKPVVLHGQPPGIQSMGPGGVSYYLSYTRMKAVGELSSNCTFLACDTTLVTGLAWHDHQWGDFSLSDFAGWDWFSIQFENNTELMLYLIRQPDGSYSTQAGSLITASAEVIDLTQEDFDLSVIGTPWESSVTGGIYPLEWRLVLPTYGIDVTLEPAINQQEMDTRASTGIVYWEGAMEVKGSHQGLGYMELTNYDLYPYGKTDETTPLQPLRGPLGRR
jgi:predicted secreted hydrolase